MQDHHSERATGAVTRAELEWLGGAIRSSFVSAFDDSPEEILEDCDSLRERVKETDRLQKDTDNLERRIRRVHLAVEELVNTNDPKEQRRLFNRLCRRQCLGEPPPAGTR